MPRLFDSAERLMVVAPHPDDEVLGAGGLLARAVAAGMDTAVLLATHATTPPFDPGLVEAGRKEMREAHGVLRVGATHELTLPAAAVDTWSHARVNAALAEVLADFDPDVLLLPFPGDIHRDHQAIFESAMVAARPGSAGAPAWILAYETLSETNWNAPYLTPGFHPTVSVDISAHLGTKLEAMGCYRSQLRDAPHERSLAALESLARLRGATMGWEAAEAFVLVRCALG